MIRFLIVATSLVVFAVTNRPKTKDVNGHTLIDLADVGDSCTDSYSGYAIVDGSLERCENFTSIQKGGGEKERKEYEEYKCRVLRAHGEIQDGMCVCKGNWKGPACNDYDGCPAARPSLHAGSCSKSGCAHDGIMAIGSKHLECICKDQWDGRHCERQACWTLHKRAGQEIQKRKVWEVRGENCSVVKSCEKNGKLENGVCKCNDGYGGETCERKCPPGEVTCSSCSALISLSILAILFHLHQ